MRKEWRAGILTASDKGFAGERKDLSGPAAAERLEAAGFRVERYSILPDEADAIQVELLHMCDSMGLDLVVTTGGTGFAPRDVTPEATAAVLHRTAPGVAEAIRAHSMTLTPKAMLSRGICGIRGRTLIVNLPGSPRSVRESLDFVLEPLLHGLEILQELDAECAR